MSDALPTAPPTAPEPADVTADLPSIGEATMQPDGTIVLHLRASTGAAVGDALLSYPPDHPQYKTILQHLGGLVPGESKPVPPFS